MARHDSDERVINRREIKNAIAEYLYGSGYPIDVDHMGDFLFDGRNPGIRNPVERGVTWR